MPGRHRLGPERWILAMTLKYGRADRGTTKRPANSDRPAGGPAGAWTEQFSVHLSWKLDF